ncbi:hypothetical protein [Corynebacterium sp. NML180780]|uniref:hypothetical protein n=1 Tax=Corynebacterium sp. NML180780 TaxID=2598459 RepID=UPI001196977E|nr:hypothetical protein [Corynebacterium sp. NML180780]TVX82518.1 hypothetical protein FPP74_00525 [Corynebacterium sp. NML180780]
MTRRDDEATEEFAAVADVDAWLDAIAAGEDPSGGEDELAALFLDLKGEVDRPASEPLLIDATSTPSDDPDASDASDETGTAGSVIPFRSASRKPRRSRRGVSPWVSGLVGAAAATAVVTGSGAALYNATPGSPLWGPATAVFGDRTAAVELAATLDELEAANDSGDKDAASALFEQARALLASMEPRANQGRDGEEGRAPITTMRTKVSTVTVTPPPAEPPASAPEPQTVTETVVPSASPQPTLEQPASSAAARPSAQPSSQAGQSSAVRPNPLPQPSAAAPSQGAESGNKESAADGAVAPSQVDQGAAGESEGAGAVEDHSDALGQAQNY